MPPFGQVMPVTANSTDPACVAKITSQKLIYSELTITINAFHWWAILASGRRQQTSPATRGSKKELRGMSFAQFRADAKRARSRRRLYARINAMPSSTVREELLAIAQRHESDER